MAQNDPLVGKVVADRFRVVEALGAGGMGRVYKAVQLSLGRLVALKVLNPQHGAHADPGFEKRFFLEASVTSKLHHPNTITIIDYGRTEDGLYYLAMEYVDGVTLAQRIVQGGPLLPARALHIAQQVARSLREAHRAGVIHRDLKPANVMLVSSEDDTDHVKVLDFGLVKTFLSETSTPPEEELTQVGIFLGSPRYMAPEQARNEADPRSDIYSLGVLLYEMLLGRPPFQGAQGLEVITQHLNAPPPPFAQVAPQHGVPQVVEVLVMRCLEKQPAARFQSMDELLEAIRLVQVASRYMGASAPSSSDSHPTLLPPGASATATPAENTLVVDISVDEGQRAAPQRRSTAVPLAVGAAVLLALGAGAVVALRRAPAPPEAPAPALQASPQEVAQPRPPSPGPQPGPAPVAAAEPAPSVASAPAPSAGAAPGAASLPLPPAEPAPAGATAPPPPTVPGAPAATAPAPRPAPPGAPRVEPVRFLVASEPAGAHVFHGGRDLGPTPVQVSVPAGAGGLASAALTFALQGYQRVTVTARGKGPEVRFTQRLERSAPPEVRVTPGYKEDPYQ